jgi:hypothetical protein
MKPYCLPRLAVMLFLILFSCDLSETDENLIKYNDAPQAVVTIKDIPPSSGFSPGTVLYIKFDDSGKNIQGNAPVGADGTAVISPHLPTGIPYKVVRAGKTTLFILRDNKTKEELFKTGGEISLEPHAANISLSFTDFIPVSNP